jgi:hypothetical protein
MPHLGIRRLTSWLTCVQSIRRDRETAVRGPYPNTSQLLMCFCLAGTGVTARNSVRIYEHVADSNFVTSHSRRICDDLKELAERTVVSVSEKVHSILNATDADLETIQAPDAALLEKYPAFGRRVEEMLRTARTDLESIEVAARGAREDATRRGYI